MIRSIPFTFAFSLPLPASHWFSRGDAKSMTLPVLPHPVWTSRPPDFRPAYGGRGCCRNAGSREWERTAFVHRSILSRSTLREEMTRRAVQPSRDSVRVQGQPGNTITKHVAHDLFSFFFLFFLSWNNSMRYHEMYRMIVIKELKIIFGKLYSMIIRRVFFLKELLLFSKKGIFKEFFFGKIITKL